jgi:curved DNA-binding protein
MAEDLYKTLGVDKSAEADAIKKSYRNLARDLHPDRNPNNKQAEARFKRVNHAYEVLSDKQKRALYDEFGEDGLRESFDADRERQARAWRSQGGGGGARGPRLEDLFGGGGFGGGGGGDPFADMFGQRSGGRRRGPSPGADLESEVSVDFADAVRGTSLELRVNGQGITVKIPKGASTGMKLRVAGRGNPSQNGGPAGDLILTVKVLDHASFKRDGDDLHVEVPLTLSEAFFGTKVNVPTASGSVTMKVPEHTQGGTVLRARGKGVERVGAPAGDLYVKFVLRLPNQSGDDGIAKIFEALKPFETEDPRKDLKL